MTDMDAGGGRDPWAVPRTRREVREAGRGQVPPVGPSGAPAQARAGSPTRPWTTRRVLGALGVALGIPGVLVGLVLVLWTVVVWAQVGALGSILGGPGLERLEGTTVAVTQGGHTPASCYPVVEFTLPDGSVHRLTSSMSEEPCPPAGMRVGVLVDPDSPGDGVIDVFRSHLGAGVVAVTSVSVLVLVGAVLMLVLGARALRTARRLATEALAAARDYGHGSYVPGMYSAGAPGPGGPRA